MPFKQHPTDPDKMVYVRPQYNLMWPKREWVGLTDDEVVACYDQVYGFNMQWGAFYKVIEAKLKEKNT